MLQAIALTVRAGAKTLLDGVTLELRPGEVLAVAGPNGAGKSSLLRAMSGELAPFAGRVLMNGRPLAEWPPQRAALLRGVLPQSAGLAFRFTVRDVALMGRSPRGNRAVSTSQVPTRGHPPP